MSRLRALVVCLLASVLAAVASFVAACDSSGTIVPTDGGTDAKTFDVVTFDGPTPFEGGAPGDGGDAGTHDAAPTGDGAAFGFIELSQVAVGGGQFVAAFYGAPPGPEPGCTYAVADAGPCLVTTCPAQTPTDAGGVSLVTAGSLTVTGGVFGDAGIELGPDNLGSYLYNTVGPMFAAGDTLSVMGAGATVPAFTAQTLVAPGPITLTAPAPDGGVLTIPTTQNLALTWTGGSAGDRMFLKLSAFFQTGAAASAICSWDATLGNGTVPASALAPLAAGTPQPNRSSAVWYQQADTTFAAGRWNVVLRAFVSGGSLAAFQ
jgi:hypothetical protein